MWTNRFCTGILCKLMWSELVCQNLNWSLTSGQCRIRISLDLLPKDLKFLAGFCSNFWRQLNGWLVPITLYVGFNRSTYRSCFRLGRRYWWVRTCFATPVMQGVLLLVSGFFRLPGEIPNPVTKYPLFYINFFSYALQVFQFIALRPQKFPILHPISEILKV